MDSEEGNKKVSLPGAGETEPQLTILEQQNLVSINQIGQEQHQPPSVPESTAIKITPETSESINDNSKISVENDLEIYDENVIVNEPVENIENPQVIVTFEVDENEQNSIAVDSQENSIDLKINADEVTAEVLTKIENVDESVDRKIVEFDIRQEILLHSENDSEIIVIINEEVIKVRDPNQSKDSEVDEAAAVTSSLELEKQSETVTKELIPDDKVKEEVLTTGTSNLTSEIASYYPKTTHEDNRPPVPLKTYRWEDIRRAKKQGGYPWTHLYKPPLGLNDEPEIILRYQSTPKYRRRNKERLLDLDESPSKTHKKVRIDEEVSVKETGRYIQELDEDDYEHEIGSSADEPQQNESNEQNIEKLDIRPVNAGTSTSFVNTLRHKLSPRNLLKRTHPTKIDTNSEPPPETFDKKEDDSPKKTNFCHPLVDKIKTMAEKQFGKGHHNKNIIRIPLKDSDKVVLEEEQKILNLKESPKAGGREISSYIEKHDSDEIIEIMEYRESPGETRKRREQSSHGHVVAASIVIPDEIIDLPPLQIVEEQLDASSTATGSSNVLTGHLSPSSEDISDSREPTVAEILEEEMKNDPPPKKSPRRQKEHVYEDIEDYTSRSPDDIVAAQNGHPPFAGHAESMDSEMIKDILGQNLKISLQNQDEQVLQDIAYRQRHLDELTPQSSEDEQRPINLSAPISSIDSASSDDEKRFTTMPIVTEESDQENANVVIDHLIPSANQTKLITKEGEKESISETPAAEVKEEMELKSVLKMESSPSFDKRVTFSPTTEDDPDLRKEDVPLQSAVLVDSRWSKMSDHEYEPIGEPMETNQTQSHQLDREVVEEPETEGAFGHTPITETSQKRRHSDTSSTTSHERKLLQAPTDEEMTDTELTAQEVQKQIEDRYFNVTPTIIESLADDEFNTSGAVDSNIVEDLPLKQENRKKTMQDRGRQMQQKLRSQAGKLQSKFKRVKKPEGEKRDSPITKERKKFKAPEFKKWKNIQMPKMKAPEFKKPDFKIPKFRSQQPKTSEPKVSEPKISEPKISEPEISEPEISEPEISESKISEPKISEEIEETVPEIKKTESKKYEFPKFTKPSMPKFKTPEVLKFKKPEFKRPEFTKMEFKRPEFTKSFPDRPRLSKPELPRFKITERFTQIRLKRSKSLKETTSTDSISDNIEPITAPPIKKRFDFGTYPRIFDKFKRQKSSDKGAIPKTKRPGTPPPIVFATVPRVHRRRDPDEISADAKFADDESGKYKQYPVEPEEFERESSLERRMRIHLSRAMHDDEFEEHNILQTDEQRQMDDFDKENREIHVISMAREEDFKQRKPLVHQDSDLVSEESGKWTGSDGFTRYLDQRHLDDIDFIESLKESANKFQDMDNNSIPQSNKETHSSGSSSERKRKGVIEEIDDDEFFLRSKGISQDNIEIGEYISSAIREGLSDPVNSLAEVGRYHPYYDEDIELNSEPLNYGYDVPPKKPQRVRNLESREEYQFDRNDSPQGYEIKESYMAEFRGNDYFNTFPPNKPIRKSKQNDSDDHLIPHVETYYLPHDEDRTFYENEQIEGIEQPDIFISEEGDKSPVSYEDQLHQPFPPTPPKAPKRRKKTMKEPIHEVPVDDGFIGRSVSNSFIPKGDNIIVYRTDHEYVIPLAQPETFITPIPTPRRTRSRSQNSRITDDDRTSHGADSLISDTQVAIEEPKCVLEYNVNNGYAVVKKEPPPRPPAPLRRKRSTKSLGEQQFATMPIMRRESTPPPARPNRNYSTIIPSRPPRTKSISSLGEPIKPVSSPDVTQYEEIEAVEKTDSHRDLQSGDIINKMKDRPLPPPPRPARTLRRSKKPSNGKQDKTDKKENNDKDDRDGGGERIEIDLCEPTEEPLEFTIEESAVIRNSLSDIVPEQNIDTEQIIKSSTTEEQNIEEVEVSTQTDPLPDDFCCEDLEITSDMRTITPTKVKTLEDILKEEQEAEFERAQQLAAEESLSRGLQRFREANQRSYSEKSKTSTIDRPKTPGSRPMTPSAVVVERKISTPTFLEHRQELITEATLLVQPVDAEIMDDLPAPAAERPIVMETKEINLPQVHPLHEEHDVLKEHTTLTTPHSSEVATIQHLPAQSEETQVQESQSTLESQSESESVPKQTIMESQDIEDDNLKDDEFDAEIERRTQLLEQAIELLQYTPPPIPPPRRKSSAADTETPVQQSEHLPQEQQYPPPPATDSRDASEGRLHIGELDVDRLNVTELNAGRIMVSEIQGMSITAQDFDCKSGNLIVKSIEFPPGFIDDIVDRVRISDRESLPPPPPPPPTEDLTQQTEPDQEKSEEKLSQEEHPPPARPPPPQSFYHIPSEYLPFSIPPPSFYQLRNYSDEDLQAPPSSSQRRRRHHRRRESTSEEENQREQKTRTRPGTRSPEPPSITNLSGQLLRACGSTTNRSVRQLLNMIRSNLKDDNRKEFNLIIMLLVILIASLILMSMGGEKTVHHHHWDFFNAPGSGEGQK